MLSSAAETDEDEEDRKMTTDNEVLCLKTFVFIGTKCTNKNEQRNQNKNLTFYFPHKHLDKLR